ncbi:MAG TPA: GNAT family N-acetyltransferase [Candidatus Baltobacteraceae bacterium]|jgi:RimJ/RimL family protein N-acetyltransferase
MSADSNFAAHAPVIETPRLVMRAHRLEDFPACAAMWADPIVTRYIGGKPSTQMETWGRLMRYVGHWALLGFGYWAIQDKASGNFAGELGFADFKRDMQPSIDGMPELGWALATPFHGKGYATEAVRAAIAWGDAHFGSARTVCLIDPENLASIRVAQKCGYMESERTTWHGLSTVLFTR